MIRVYNTLTGKKEDFQPISDTVTMYVCGVTVYDDCHIGHAMSYIIFDAIRRYLEFRDYKVNYIQNFTDIDDKIINRANELGIPSGELAGKYIEEYFKDMDILNIKRATKYPLATEEIPTIIEIIKGLIDKGYAYETDGSVYFRVNKFKDYGKLSHQKTDDMVSEPAGEGVQKESPLDFALWKAAKPDEPAWECPWGKGRPGWHIECSAMSLKYLGDQIDIHGGGQDLIFPHHENEITQSESYTGKTPFAKYWLHNGLLQLKGTKMSKSIGNLVNVKDILKKYSPDAVRLFVLNSHYRSPLLYSEESLDSAETAMERLRQAAIEDIQEYKGEEAIDAGAFKQRFIDSMDDDFNTAQAIAVLFDLAKEINRASIEKQNTSGARAMLNELAGIIGFTLEQREKLPIDVEPLIELLINIRSDLRTAKQWELADKVRNKLEEQGIILEDSKDGTTWKRS
jgi:cysteinyl-tRNA synthetase